MKLSCFLCAVGILALYAGCGDAEIAPQPADTTGDNFDAAGDDAAVCLEMFFNNTPQLLDFGAVALNSSKMISVQIMNAGACGLLIVSDITLEGLSTDEFKVEVEGDAADVWAQEHKITLAPGESSLIDVTYAPSDTGGDSGNIVFTHNVGVQDFFTKVAVTTSGPPEALTCNPNPIDFGEVKAGTTATLEVTITNNSALKIHLQDVYVDHEGSYDFWVNDVISDDGAGDRTILDQDENINVVLKYSPSEGGADASRLVVLSTVDGSDRTWSFEVKGSQLGPMINVLPDKIDFGQVSLDETKTAAFTISNEGNADLIIWSIISLGSDKNLKTDDSPNEEEPVVLAPSEFHEFHTTWTPKEPHPDPNDLIGALQIESNDALSNPTIIPIYGVVQTP